jgi:uncharacterized protein YcfJ
MKRVASLLLCFSFIVFGLGCQNTKTHAVEGGVIGGVLGAGVGGIIGHQMHHGAEGAAIGAAAGILGGALIGAQMEKPGQAANQNTGSTQAVSSNQMTQQQVIDLVKQGVDENVVIDKIRLSNSKFILSAEQVSSLKQQGVSQKIIEVMQGLS